MVASVCIVYSFSLTTGPGPRVGVKRKKRLRRPKKQKDQQNARSTHTPDATNAMRHRTKCKNDSTIADYKSEDKHEAKGTRKNTPESKRTKCTRKAKGTNKARGARKAKRKRKTKGIDKVKRGTQEANKERATNRVDGGCGVCGGAEQWDAILLCDKCEGEYHYFCVNLDAIPDGEWFCPQCSKKASDG